MTTLPSGTVTFLFTDIEGSTKLAQVHPDKWDILQQRHHSILQSAIESHNGYIFQIIGDAFCAAFHTAKDGINAAIEAQSKLQSEDWGGTPVKVRMGLHTGEVEIQSDGQYHGYLAMSRVQRLMSAGHGGQVLVSQATRELIRDDLLKDVSLRDLGEKRLKDLILPEHIYQLDIANLPVDFPSLKTLDKYRHNLPVQLTSFIGREKEMTEVKQALAEHRLVTLTGSGGAGKTRLSLQVAADLLDQFPNGVWFVELSSITDPDLIPQTILSAADMQTQQGRSALDSLKDFLREKTSLLVLDNCEHLIETCAKLANMLLSAAPNLKILASSREALGVRGEQAWHVPSLSIPDVKHLPPIEGLSQYEAVRLFIDRALLVQPHFAVTNDNAPAVAQICSRLDGIPLAIELAAAKIRILNVEQIAKRLNDRFRLLTSRSRTALERHQTLRAAIDWSYNLLPSNEQILFRRLSVFVGGWTLEAAESVCGDEPIKGDHVVELLEQLINKSIVIAEETQSEPRYKILETIRQYANEKLVEVGEEVSMHQKHAECFSKLAEETYHGLLAKQNEYKLVKQLKGDLDNFRTALGWLSESSACEDGIWLTIHLEALWMHQSLFQEGFKWLEVWLENRTSLPMKATAFALMLMGMLSTHTEDYDKAFQYGAESIGLFRELGDKFALAQGLHQFGTTFDDNGDYDKAYSYYSEALALYRELDKKELANDILISMGWIRWGKDSAEGFAILEECLQTARKFNEPSTLGHCLYALGHCRWQSKELEKAESNLKEALKLYYQLDNILFMLGCLGMLGGITASRGQLEQATKITGAMIKGIELLREAMPPYWKRDIHDPLVASVRKHLDDRDFENAWQEGYSLSMNQVITFALEMANE